MRSDLLKMMIILVILSDEELAKLVIGDKEMLSKLYEIYKKKIHTYFFVKTFGDREASEDLTHETFCSIIRSAERLKSGAYIDFWIFSIARRRLHDYQRALYRRKTLNKDLSEHDTSKNENHEGNVIEEIDLKQKTLLLALAVERLNPDYRRIYELRYREGKKRSEIANQLGKTEKAVESLITRLNKCLKTEMMRLAADFF